MKTLLLLALSLSLSACAAYAPGEDDYGRVLQGNGEAVLSAARNYMDETARVPNSIDELIPKYLKARPAQPDVKYDRKTSTFYFVYTQQGTNGLTVTCHALLGQLQWVCI